VGNFRVSGDAAAALLLIDRLVCPKEPTFLPRGGSRMCREDKSDRAPCGSREASDSETNLGL
jgi:hypothetical protein